jgi:uncharacterized OB-fold protein
MTAQSVGGATGVIEEHWDITYRHAIGKAATEFFSRLVRDEVIVGRRCPQCTRVLVPPRGFCDRCFVETEETVVVGTSGSLEAFTIVNQTFQGLPKAPYCFGYVLLDGADTAVLNYIKGIDLGDVDAAARFLMTRPRLTTVFSSDKRGSVLDFWFEPVGR